MLTMFFDVKGVILEEWLLEGTTVKHHYYKEALTKLKS